MLLPYIKIEEKCTKHNTLLRYKWQLKLAELTQHDSSRLDEYQFEDLGTLLVFLTVYIECNRRNGPDFRRVFLRSNYTDIAENTYIQSSMVTEILAREVWNIDSYYSLTDYQIHMETGRNMWFL